MTGFVKTVRDDGKLDITLQTTGKRHVEDFSTQLFRYIQNCEDYFCPFHDKSLAEDIYNEFQVSKKTFKKAVGDLYKRNLISLHDDGLRLTKEGLISGINEE